MSGYQSVTLFRSMSGSGSAAAANRRSFVFCVVSVLIVFSGLVSCSGSGEEDGSTSTTVIPAATAATDGSSTTEAAVDVGVNVKVASSAVGEVLSDGQGHVFYIFTPDGTGAATCVDACAGAWPPVLTEGGVVADAAVSGLKLGEVGQGSSAQLTIQGQPVYYFSADTEPGSSNGQGSGGKWFVLDTEGKPVQTETAQP